jgi:hypothetical protein
MVSWSGVAVQLASRFRLKANVLLAQVDAYRKLSSSLAVD